MTNGTPIPFFGWLMEDAEDTQQMLRKQIEIQQDIIKKLEGDVKMLQEECVSLIKQIGEIQ
jgi:hypothetical protein